MFPANRQRRSSRPTAIAARFVILFDREGYSPEFFKEMWQTHRIACISYHKYPKDDWPAAEFAEIETTLPGGERVKLQLAERGTWIGDRKSGLWVREIRKLTPSGHQVSLISTAYGELALQDAAQLFSRWSQENFFRYVMQHFAIDLLNEYGTEEIPETKRPVVNPDLSFILHLFATGLGIEWRRSGPSLGAAESVMRSITATKSDGLASQASDRCSGVSLIHPGRAGPTTGLPSRMPDWHQSAIVDRLPIENFRGGP